MAGELVQHVIEKRHAGAHLAAARAIEAEAHVHLGFAGHAINGSDAGHGGM